MTYVQFENDCYTDERLLAHAQKRGFTLID